MPRSRTRGLPSRCSSAPPRPDGRAPRATKERCECRAGAGSPESTAALKSGLDLRRQGLVEVLRNAHLTLPPSRLARLGTPVVRHELGERLACLGEDDLLAVCSA